MALIKDMVLFLAAWQAMQNCCKHEAFSTNTSMLACVFCCGGRAAALALATVMLQ